MLCQCYASLVVKISSAKNKTSCLETKTKTMSKTGKQNIKQIHTAHNNG